MFDCRPPGLPVSIPLSGFSPAVISGARDCTSHQQLEQSSRSIINMDTNEISISGIIGFPWNDRWNGCGGRVALPGSTPGSDYVPRPLSRKTRVTPFGRDTNYDLDLADVFQDATVLPALVTPLEDTEATVAGTAGYLQSPRGARRDVPYQRGTPPTEESFLQLLREPREPPGLIRQPLRRLVRTPVRRQ